MKFNSTNLNVIMYVIIFVFAIYVLLSEQADWQCPGIMNFLRGENCKEAMPYRGSKPETDDSCNILLGKINVAAATTSKEIKWRRSFLLAVLISLVVYVLVISPGNLPVWTQFYIVTIIITCILYFNMNYYDYHKYNTPREYIAESTTLINEKINQGNC